jgi:two-component system OmpR family sensor kinase
VRRYLAALLPLGLGLLLAVAWQSGLWPNPILYLRADVGTLLALLGALAALVCGLVAAARQAAGQRAAQSLARLREEQAESHRRFIRRLDHELKNPITAIGIGLANLANRGENPIIASVHVQVDRLARLTADLRKLADLETQPLEQEPLVLEDLLTEVVESIRERPGTADRQLQLHLPRAPWPLPPVAGDRDLLFLALYNLLDNAAKYSCPEDTIEVRAFEDGAVVVVEIADTGPGIPEDDLPHLGEELYRGSAPRSIEGSGLGLALVRAIVTRHRGTLAIRSRLGQGTLVSLRLPAAG